MLYPEPTLLFAQAVILGLALTLVAGLLERSVARRRRRIAQFPEPSGLALQQAGVPPSHRVAAPGGQGSTQSAPAIVSLPNPDANP